MKKTIFFAKGMHCASCEILIEKKLLELDGIKVVNASVANNSVEIEYDKNKPSVSYLNRLFKKEGYTFSENNSFSDKKESKNKKGIIISILTAIIIILIFVFLQRTGLSSLISVNSNSFLPAFIVFGLLAGVSSCAALVGGLVLSMAKQWSEVHKEESRFAKKFEPHVLFNIGRIISFAIFGGLIGGLGGLLNISLSFQSVLILIVSILMIFLGLQMLGVKQLQRFQIASPKFLTRFVSDEKKFKGKFMPLIMGALTFFLPCGFTITAQSLALISGSPIRGALIMLFFALGTLVPLLIIGFTSAKLIEKKHISNAFLMIAGILVLFFGLFNINNQLNTLGWKSLNNIIQSTTRSASNQKPVDIVKGKQIIKMNAGSSGYDPNYFKVKVGVPVRFEITDTGTSGCTNAIISRNLFNDTIQLEPGKTSVKEFTPEKVGSFKFSCWMGMVTGTIDVVSSDNSSVETNSKPNTTAATPTYDSGASGCGCGGI